jgi:hypothetical protein
MLAIILFTAGAVVAALALTAETCTQGGADSLYAGFLTLPLYLVAGASAADSLRPYASSASLG